MSRSVSRPSNAQVVAFACIESEDDDDLNQMNWDDTIENLVTELLAAFPGLRKVDRWLDREDHVIAENGLAAFGISEYCGLVAVWIVPDKYELGCKVDDHPLSVKWIASIEKQFHKIVAQVFGFELRHIATASNGEAFFERVGA